MKEPSSQERAPTKVASKGAALKKSRKALSELEKIGARVRMFRSARGLSQAGLAKLAECTPADISRIESGKVNFLITKLDALAKALNLALIDLVNVDDTTPRGRLVELTRHRDNVDLRRMLRAIHQLVLMRPAPAPRTAGPRGRYKRRAS